MVRLTISFRGSWFSAFRGADLTAKYDGVESGGPSLGLFDNPTLNRHGARKRHPSDSTALGILLRMLGEVRSVRSLSDQDFERHFNCKSKWIVKISELDSNSQIVEETASVRRPDGGTRLKGSSSGLRMPEKTVEFVSTHLNLVWWPLFASPQEISEFLLSGKLPCRIDLDKDSKKIEFSRDAVYSAGVRLESLKEVAGPHNFGSDWFRLHKHILENNKKDLITPLRLEFFKELKPSQVYFYACYKTLNLLKQKGVDRSKLASRLSAASITGIDAPRMLGGKSFMVIASVPATGGESEFLSTPAKIQKACGTLILEFLAPTESEKYVYDRLLNSPVTRFNVGKKGIAWMSDIYLEAQ